MLLLKVQQNKSDSAVDRAVLYLFCGAVFFTPASISLSSIFAYMALAVSVLSGRIIQGMRIFSGRRWFYPVLALVVMPWLGLLYAADSELGLKYAIKTHYWLFAVAVLPLAFHRFSAQYLSRAFLLGLSLSAVVIILQFAGIVPLYEHNKLGFIHHITYSLFLVFGMLLLSFFFNEAREKKTRLLVMLLFLLLFLNLVIGIGRVGYLSFILLCPLMAYNIFGRRHLFKVGLACVVLTGLMFIFPVVRGRVAEVMGDVKTYQKGDSFTSVGMRLHMWNGAVKLFLQDPVIGIGTGSYSVRMMEYSNPSVEELKFSQPHNSYLYMAVSFGIPGLAVLLWFFAVMLRAGWRGRRTLQGFTLLSYILVVMLGSLTDTQIIQGQSAMLLAVFTGLDHT